VAILCLAALAGCTSGIIPGLAPSPSKAEIARWAQPLPEAEAKALIVHHGEHSNIYDARIHTGKTCPIYIYSPKYKNFQAGLVRADDWAKFLGKFFRYKHKEEGSCDCDELLGLAAPAPAPDGPAVMKQIFPEADTPAAPVETAPTMIPTEAAVPAEIEEKMDEYIDLFNKFKGRK